jgi:hypothetical protein
MRWKYEYKAILLATAGGGWSVKSASALNQLAEEGWHLVTVDNGIAYLKRIVWRKAETAE